MARTIRDEELKVTININGDPARKELAKLDDERRKMLKTQKEMLSEKSKLEKAGKQESAAYIELTQKIADNSKALDTNKAKMDQLKGSIGLTNLSIKELRNTARALKAQRDLQPPDTAEWHRLNKALNEADARLKQLNGNGQKMKGMMGNIFGGAGMGAMLKGAGPLGAVVGVGAVLKDGFNTILEFDKAAATLSALTDAKGADLQFYKDQAVATAIDMKVSATDVLKAYELVGGAQPYLLENKELLAAVTSEALLLSKASGMELPTAVEKLTDVMNQFGVSAKDAPMYVDALAAGAKYGSAQIPELSDSIVKFGASAKASNITIHETVGMVELLAEKGLKGAEAGTKLNVFLSRMSAAKGLPKEALDQLAKYGVNLDVVSDKNLTLLERLSEFRKVVNDDVALVKIFGTENLNASRLILENAEAIDDLTQKVKERGVAQEQALIQMDNLSDDVDSLSIGWDAFVLSVAKGDGIISKTIRGLVQATQGLLDALHYLNNTRAGESWFDGLTRKLKAVNPHFALMDFQVDKMLRDAQKLRLEDTVESPEETERRMKEAAAKAKELEESQRKEREVRAKEIAAERVKTNKDNHNTIMSALELQLKEEAALHASAYEQGLLDREQYEEGLIMLQVSALAKQKLALQAHLKTVSKTEVEERRKIMGQILDLEKQASLLNVQLTNKPKSSFDTDAFLADHEKYDSKGNVRNDDQGLADRVKREKDRIAMANASMGVLTAKPGSKGELEAHQNMLKLRMQMELETVGLTEEEKREIEERYRQENLKLEDNYNKGRAEFYLGTLSTMVSAGVALMNNASQKELNREKQLNDSKKLALQKQLDSKQISEEEYRRKVEKIDEQARKREAEIKTKQFKRQKAADLIQAGINTALAITKALPNVFLAAAAGIAGAAQAAIIATTPVPVFDKGKYPVMGTDGQKYKASFAGNIRTGYYQSATMMVGERRPEIVIDGATTAQLMRFRPDVIDAIYSASGRYASNTRMPVYDSGKYPQNTNSTSNSPAQSQAVATSTGFSEDDSLRAMYEVLTDLRANGIEAKISWRQYNDFKEKAEQLEKDYRV